jgi:CPA2 family monovalent cation:H+ antiporter-2
VHSARTFLQDLALICCVSAVVTVLFRRLRQPVVLGYLLAGIIIGPNVPIPLFADMERIQDLSELGVILVMFSIGLEFSIARFVRVLPTAGLTGFIQMSGLMWLGYTAGSLLGWSWKECLFAGAIVSISSTIIVARAFADQKVERQLSELAFGVLIVEDLVAVLLITVLTAVAAGSSISAGELMGTTGRLVAFVIALLVVGFLVVPRAIRAVCRLQSPETLLVASVGLCFGMALLAQKLGYSVALGAFVAGSLIAESGRQKQVAHLVAPLRDLFAAVFFVSVGMMVDPGILRHQWPAVLVLTAIVIFGNIGFVSLGSFLSGMGVRASIRTGMSLAQIGEFSFIIASVGVASGAIGGFLYPVAVAVAVITSFTTPWMVRASERVALQVEQRLPRPIQTFAALYARWLEEMRARWIKGQRGTRVRRRMAMLVLDAAIITAISVMVAVEWDALSALLTQELGLSRVLSSILLVTGGFLLVLPFARGMLRRARRIGAGLAGAVLPDGEVGRVDMAAAPRRALILALQLAIVLLMGIPILAVTQLFMPLFYGALILMAVVIGLGVALWRSTTNLDGHVRAGAELVLELLSRQRQADVPTANELLDQLLPGLGPITPVRLRSDSPAVGRTLAELNLRGLTGALVLAIVREPGRELEQARDAGHRELGRKPEQARDIGHGLVGYGLDSGEHEACFLDDRFGDGGIVNPTGHEILHAGDVLALFGTQEAVQAAIAVVTGDGRGLPRVAQAVETGPHP